MLNEDTIVARATAPGEAAIAIIRVSGPQTMAIVEKIFHPKTEPRKAKPLESHRLILGDIVNPKTGEIVDQVMLAPMFAPHSYTGEDMAEINCHGGYAVISGIIELAQQFGARLAEPGEFTKRAFLNGKLDLVQAEAVCDMVRSRTEAGRRLAIRQLEGSLSSQLRQLRDNLISLAAEIEARLDFPEEVMETLDVKRLGIQMNKAITTIQTLVNQGRRAKFYRQGARIALVGKPNVGKSSLFNSLLGRERAIVTAHPGTTRDTIESTVDLDGLPITYIDTAGIRWGQDEIEKLGVERAAKEIATADLILFLIDTNVELTAEDKDIYQQVKEIPFVIVLNKIDLEKITDLAKVSQVLALENNQACVEISALRHLNLNKLEQLIVNQIVASPDQCEDAIVANLRHIKALEKSEQALMQALKALSSGLSGEFVMIDINEALNEISQILGLAVDDAVLDRIFSTFCIGK